MAAGRRDIEAGRAFVTLALKNQLVSGLNRVKESLKDFERTANKIGNSLAILGGSITAPLAAAVFSSNEMKQKLTDVRLILSDAVRPALEPIADKMLEIAAGVAQWARGHQALVVRIAETGVAMTVAAGAFKIAAAAAAFFGQVITIAKSGVAALGAIIGGILTPIGLAAAAAFGGLALALASFLKFTSEGRELSYRLSTGLRDLQKRLFDTTDATRDHGRAAMDAAEANRQLEESLKAVAAAQDATTKAIIRSIDEGISRRSQLVREFETPEERYIRKRREIIGAIGEVRRNLNLNFISEAQHAIEKRSLDTALVRLDAAERERRLLLRPPEKKKPEAREDGRPEIERVSNASIATSAGGALALAFGGGAGLQKQMHDRLVEIRNVHRDGVEESREFRREMAAFRNLMRVR